MMRWGWIGTLVGLVLLLAGGSPAPAEAVWDEVTGGDPNSGMVALTFDAGGVAGPAAAVFDTLRSRGLRVTVFLTGQWVESYPELARQVADDGHELANHSYYHPDLTTLSNDQVLWEPCREQLPPDCSSGSHVRVHATDPCRFNTTLSLPGGFPIECATAHGGHDAGNLFVDLALTY